MPRKEKQIVDYFPHDTVHGKTMFILENKWGNDGYAFWFKLLELLGRTEGHAYDCNNADAWEYLIAYTRLEENIVNEILNKLALLDAIDKELWNEKIIWCDNFIDNISIVYQKRVTEIPQKPSIRRQKSGSGDVSGVGNTQSRVEESRVEESNVFSFKNQVNKKRWNQYKESITEVIEYYNRLRNRKLKPQTENYVKLLGWLFNCGYTVKQCKIVTEHRWLEWQDNDTMYKYHRPETLFAYENFQKYLPDAEEWFEKKEKNEYYRKKQLEKTKQLAVKQEEYTSPDIAKKKISELRNVL